MQVGYYPHCRRFVTYIGVSHQRPLINMLGVTGDNVGTIPESVMEYLAHKAKVKT
jgi:hypothetical protein